MSAPVINKSKLILGRVKKRVLRPQNMMLSVNILLTPPLHLPSLCVCLSSLPFSSHCPPNFFLFSLSPSPATFLNSSQLKTTFHVVRTGPIHCMFQLSRPFYPSALFVVNSAFIYTASLLKKQRSTEQGDKILFLELP